MNARELNMPKAVADAAHRRKVSAAAYRRLHDIHADGYGDYALRRIPDVDAFLLAGRGIVVSEHDEPIVPPYLVTLPIHGHRRLTLRQGLPEPVRVFLRFRAAEEVRLRRAAYRHSLAGSRFEQDVIDTVALCGVLHLSGCTSGVGGRGDGLAWLKNKLRLLGAVIDVWHGSSLPELLPVVNMTLMKLQAHQAADPTTVELEATRAYASARVAREAADYRTATAEFLKTRRLAKMCGAHRIACMATFGLGTMWAMRGNAPKARKHYQLGLREARRHELRSEEGIALHELFLLAVETGAYRHAARLAPAAFAAYAASGHPNLPRLAHDVGRFWLVVGDFAAALPVLLATLPHVLRPEERMLVWSNVAKAGGAEGHAGVYARAVDGVAACFVECSETFGESASRALLGLGEGAASLGWWEIAEKVGVAALQIALRRREFRVVFEAEAHLAYVGTRLLPAMTRRRLAAPPRGAHTDGLVDAVVAMLSRLPPTACATPR